jgi:8-oxo-dGTP pyrophosphatase MutT (NUDIX family)
MRELYRFPLSKEAVVAVDLQHVRHIPEELQERIDDIWERKDSEAGLFEAPIVSLVRYSPTHLIGDLVDFSAWYACVVDPDLRRHLDIHPLAVTGRTTWKNKILVGKRSPTLVAMRGVMECCPSGSIDQSCITQEGIADLRQAILSELDEEAGIGSDCAQSVTTRDLYLSTDTGVFDIHLDVVLYPESELSMLKSPLREYDELVWVEKGEADTIFPKRQWVPLSRYLLKEPFA